MEGDQQGQADNHVHESALAAQQQRNVGKSKAAHQSKMHLSGRIPAAGTGEFDPTGEDGNRLYMLLLSN